MSTATITVQKLIAVFGTEEAAPITIEYKGTKVTATRDDLTISAKAIDSEIAEKEGTYKVVLSKDGTFTSTYVETKVTKTRQSPSFHSF